MAAQAAARRRDQSRIGFAPAGGEMLIGTEEESRALAGIEPLPQQAATVVKILAFAQDAAPEVFHRFVETMKDFRLLF